MRAEIYPIAIIKAIRQYSALDLAAAKDHFYSVDGDKTVTLEVPAEASAMLLVEELIGLVRRDWLILGRYLAASRALFASWRSRCC